MVELTFYLGCRILAMRVQDICSRFIQTSVFLPTADQWEEYRQPSVARLDNPMAFLYNGNARSRNALRSTEMGKAKRTGHAAERAKEIFREIAEQYDSTVVFCHLGLDHPPTMSAIGFQSLCQRTLPSVTAKQRDNFQQDGWIETVSQPTDTSITNPPTATNCQFVLALVQQAKLQTLQPNLLGSGAPFDYDWVWFNSERGRFVFSQPHCV